MLFVDYTIVVYEGAFKICVKGLRVVKIKKKDLSIIKSNFFVRLVSDESPKISDGHRKELRLDLDQQEVGEYRSTGFDNSWQTSINQGVFNPWSTRYQHPHNG